MRIAQLPEPDQIRALMEGPADVPVVMVNLLSFEEHAGGGSGGPSGEASYRRYADRMVELVESRGGRVLWSGRVDSMVIGESDVEFHMIALVEYPSRRAFLEIASSPEVAGIAEDRRKGLAGQWLVAATSEPPEPRAED